MDGDTRLQRLGRALHVLLGRLDVLALFPLLTVVAHVLGMQNIALATAVILPGLLAIQALSGGRTASALDQRRRVPSGRRGILASLRSVLAQEGQDTACIVLDIDDWPALAARWGRDTSEGVVERLADRLRATLRSDDYLTRTGTARFAVVLRAIPSARLSLRNEIAARMTTSLAEPMLIGGATLQVSACIGHTALIRQGSDAATATLQAAEAALADALRQGPGSVRSFRPGLPAAGPAPQNLAREMRAAFQSGEIITWFQPRIDARTGALTGVATVSGWRHPEADTLTAADFLAAVESAGLGSKLGQMMLRHALTALHDWNRAGLSVPVLTVPMVADDLRDPSLPDRVAAELARQGHTPQRLSIALPLSVATSVEDETVPATIMALRKQGVGIELNGVEITQAAVLAIRRFGVERVALDPTVVRGIDGDEGQQILTSAIIAAAKRLGVQVVACGVETRAEQVRIARLGCDQLQGSAIEGLMAAGDLSEWVANRRNPLKPPDAASLRAG